MALGRERFVLCNYTNVFKISGFYFILLKAYTLYPRQPHRVTPGLFNQTNLTSVEYNTKHAHLTNVKHNPKVSPFGIALIKNEK